MALKALIVCKHHEGTKESDCCNIIKQKDIDFVHSWKNTLSKSELKNIDIVIAIGGDGTVLSASHYLIDKPLLAVNSSPETSVGALTTITTSQLPDKLEDIKNKKFKIENLERIEVSINNVNLEPLALNDVFIGSEKPYHPSKYEIIFKNKKEKQISSGLIFSTGTGSTAWFQSAGGKPFSSQSKFIKMIVREPYQSKLLRQSLLNCEINEKEEIKIIPSTQSILAIDSIREFSLKPDDIVKIKISSHPLKKII